MGRGAQILLRGPGFVCYRISSSLHICRNDTLSRVFFVESSLMKAIEGGNVTAMIFYLKTQGKGRGYVERSEHDLSPNGPVTLRVVYDE